MRTPVELRFEKGDPVREYWLSHGEGFAVENRRGRVVGQVVDVVVDPEAQRTVSLVVRRARGVSELSADEIQAVVPARDAFVLDGKPLKEKTPRPRRQWPRARVAPRLRRLAALLGAVGSGVLMWVVAVARLLGRELGRPRQ
jgi:sporulation protein YlmC with PRC-barrel domain